MRRPRHLKALLFARLASAAGFRVRCHWCPRMLRYEDATADHEPALASGGRPYQAVIACKRCNEERGRITDKQVKGKRGRA